MVSNEISQAEGMHTSAMASLTSTAASALVKGALSSSSIITPRSQNIGSCISDTALTESSYETRGSFGVSQSSFFEQIGAEALVI